MYVSMPSAGSSHFYRYNNWEGRQLVAVCQCPRRALLISTMHSKKNSFTSIKVSMPSAGSSHFYVGKGKIWLKKQKKGVNALGGLFSFLPKESSLEPACLLCVNALGGLFSFLQSSNLHCLFIR